MDQEAWKDPSYTGRLEFLQDKFRHPAIKHGLTKRGQNKLVEAVRRMYMAPDAQYLAEKAKEERDWPRDSGADALRRTALANVDKPAFLFLGPLPPEAEGSFLNLSPREWEPVLHVPATELNPNVNLFGGKSVANTCSLGAMSSVASSGSIPCGQVQIAFPSSTSHELSAGSGSPEAYQDIGLMTSTPPAAYTMVLPISSTKKLPRKAASQPTTPWSGTKSIPCGQHQRQRLETAEKTAPEMEIIMNSSSEHTDSESSPNSRQLNQEIVTPDRGLTGLLTELSVGLSLLTEDNSDGWTGPSKSPSKKRKRSESLEMPGFLKDVRRVETVNAGVQMPSQSRLSTGKQLDKAQQMPSQPSQSGN